jgi:hypothetical protein
MARFAPAVRSHDRDDSAVSVMVCSMTPTAVEQDETGSPEKRLDLPEADGRRRPAHLIDQFINLAHTPTLTFWLTAPSASSRASVKPAFDSATIPPILLALPSDRPLGGRVSARITDNSQS